MHEKQAGVSHSVFKGCGYRYIGGRGGERIWNASIKTRMGLSLLLYLTFGCFKLIELLDCINWVDQICSLWYSNQTWNARDMAKNIIASPSLFGRLACA